MLKSNEIICGKIIVQLGLATAEDVRAQLRTLDADPHGKWDLVGGLREAGKLDDSKTELVRHRSALYEHVRGEAVYVRLLERDTTIKKETVAKLLAQLEASAFRRRLGDVLVRRGSIDAAYDRDLTAKQAEAIAKDDQRILSRYREEDFAGVGRPLIQGSKLKPAEFKISTLFRSKQTRALVDKAEIALLRKVAAREAKLKQERSAAEQDATLIMGVETPAGAGPPARAPASSGPPTARTQVRPVLELPEPIPDAPKQKTEEQTPRMPALMTTDEVRKLKRIADYTVVEVLGVGGMGAVFLGQKDGVGEYVALKVLLNQQASPEEAGRFEREITLTQKIEHRNVITIIDRGKTPDGLSYVVVPALAGRELRDLLDKSPSGLPVTRVATIFPQILSGLQEVHSHGIVHRDLKPENVFVMAGGEDEVKIMDFGLAKPNDEVQSKFNVFRTQTGEISGSPVYMAPESVSNDPIDGRTDIYSLGVMLFEMLTGKLPLESETTSGYLTQHLICPPLTLEEACPERNWPPELESLLERMLAKTRDERPSSCDAILAELEAGLQRTIAGVDDTEEADVPLELENEPDMSGWAFKGLLGRLRKSALGFGQR